MALQTEAIWNIHEEILPQEIWEQKQAKEHTALSPCNVLGILAFHCEVNGNWGAQHLYLYAVIQECHL